MTVWTSFIVFSVCTSLLIQSICLHLIRYQIDHMVYHVKSLPTLEQTEAQQRRKRTFRLGGRRFASNFLFEKKFSERRNEMGIVCITFHICEEITADLDGIRMISFATIKCLCLGAPKWTRVIRWPQMMNFCSLCFLVICLTFAAFYLQSIGYSQERWVNKDFSFEETRSERKPTHNYHWSRVACSTKSWTNERKWENGEKMFHISIHIWFVQSWNDWLHNCEIVAYFSSLILFLFYRFLKIIIKLKCEMNANNNYSQQLKNDNRKWFYVRVCVHMFESTHFQDEK